MLARIRRVELSVAEPARFYLIWITDLTGKPGDYTVEIDEVGLSAS